MTDYEYQIAINLRDKLKEIVKGRVFCEVNDDCLHVEITTKELDTYKYDLKNFSNIFVTGYLSIREISQGIIADYKRFVLRSFFKYWFKREVLLNCEASLFGFKKGD